MKLQTFRCTACNEKLTRYVKRRKAWHATFCGIKGKDVRAKAVRPV
jgi:hypothetical protein